VRTTIPCRSNWRSRLVRVVVPLGQQAKDRGLVLGFNGPQVLAEQSNLGDVQGVGWVGLAVAAGGKQASPRGQGGGNVHNVFPCGGELLSKGSAQAAGTFHCEAALGPLLAPPHQLPEGAGVDDKAPLADLVVRRIDDNCGVRGLVGVDPNGDHAHPGLCSKRRSMRWAP
jgi:hypothetical protein